ncbi:alanine--tRNA ligase [bacterium BMS3Abin09]|nr:alanine--tRNA ligase [bacterium BMS3Abin09]GBE40763.1 alanine--tRNA ligase [bacterium BMS3Bbin09]HDH34401.1 alanine--tRNA ligase [Nitrospirota bacterium]
MQSAEIRQLFLDFFKEKEHEILPSSPLLPQDDQTLLFTNAGMVQFKTVFIGNAERPSARAVTVQKCLRAGGKHNDLENVGRTARHHTFFEMLGNFSFGDYFKKEACEWAWEFLTEWLKLPKDKLLITVYEKDDEAAEIWEKHVGIPPEKIFRLGEKDNFWQMGDTGPCGPCSEIHIDQGPETGCNKPDCQVGCDCDRYLEIWNLVFMQYNRDSSGEITPLPKPSIDTGMGIERLAAVLQGKTNNFDSDLFIPIIENVENISGKKYGADDVTNVSMRVIADHIRTTAFVLSEGLMPSNEGRGYVLRRIIRRAARHGFMLGIKGPFLYKVIDAVYDKMSGTYPELLESTDMIKKALKFEEERFAHTLSSGMEILDKLVKKVKSLKQTKLPGSELFKLYDTFGFPLDLAQDIADDNGLEVDHQGFNEEMERQKTTARASWIGTEDKPPQVYSEIKKELDHTEFLGYETLQSDASVVALIKKNKAADEAGEGEEAEIVLDRSPFYGESGGQVGDTGTIRADNMKFKVSYTKKINNILIHSGTVIRGTINKGMSVQAAVQEDRRRDIMRNHTATHLLHKALKEVLGDHIKQAGSLVAHDRLRFDFNHFFAMDEHEVSEVEEIVNEKIMENIPVDVTESSLDDAISKGVTALFGEKYGQKVRVVRGGDFTAELCGGTHCRATGEIGPFKIVSEGSVASGIRRIEALTGLSSLDFNRERENELKKAAGLLRVNEMGVSGKVKKIIADMKQNEKELEKIKNKATAGNAGGIIKNVIEIGGVKVLAYKAEGMDMKGLRDLSDKLKDKMGSGIIVLGSVLDGNAYYVSVVTKDLVPAFNAGDILKAVTGGKGGGRPDMAQGGTKDTDGIDKAIGSVEGIIKDTSL